MVRFDEFSSLGLETSELWALSDRSAIWVQSADFDNWAEIWWIRAVSAVEAELNDFLRIVSDFTKISN